MSKAVLISIRPEWCEKISSGQKTIEVRKTRPKIETPFKCYIYETKGKCAVPRFVDEEGHMDFSGKGQVIGEFICDHIEEFESEFYSDDSVMNGIYRVVEDEDYPGERLLTQIASNEEDSENYWICTQSYLSFDEIKEYIGYDKSDKTFYGWHISDLVIYDKPKELTEFAKPGFIKFNEMDPEELCTYCADTDYGEKAVYGTPNGPVMCEGRFCDKAYQRYLDEEGFTLYRPPQSWCYVEVSE